MNEKPFKNKFFTIKSGDIILLTQFRNPTKKNIIKNYYKFSKNDIAFIYDYYQAENGNHFVKYCVCFKGVLCYFIDPKNYYLENFIIF